MLCQENFVDIKDLPDSLKDSTTEEYPSAPLYPFPNLTLEELEKRHILSVLKRTNNNKQKAAKLLGLSRQALYRKLKKYNLS